MSVKTDKYGHYVEYCACSTMLLMRQSLTGTTAMLKVKEKPRVDVDSPETVTDIKPTLWHKPTRRIFLGNFSPAATETWELPVQVQNKETTHDCVS